MSDTMRDHANGPTHKPTYLSLLDKNPAGIKEPVTSEDPSSWYL